MTVFTSPYASQYDNLYAEKDYAAECDLVEAAAAARGVRIETLLDVGCGTGGHSLEWARRGIATSGVDFSASMIEIARRKAQATDLPVQPEWHVGDARDFELGQSFDAATMMFAVLGYMNGNDDVIGALKTVRRHLRAGGLFVFDVWYGPAVLSVRPETRVRTIEGGDQRILRAASTEIDGFRQLAEVTFRLWTMQGDRLLGESEETHRMRYFFPQELILFLQVAGFDRVEIRSFPDGGTPGDTTWNVYCTAIAS